MMGLCGKAALTLLIILGIGFIYIMKRGAPLPKPDPNPWWKKTPGKDNEDITKFKIKVDEKDLKDLNLRLNLPHTLTPALQNANFTYGVNTDTFQQVVHYWKTKYNWRQREQKLNTVNHFKTQIEGLSIHFVRITPKNLPPNTIVRPLLLLHGWPGSVVEFYDLFPILTQPNPNSNIVFEVIAPSNPGCGFSDASEKMGFGPIQVSQVFYKLMKRLQFSQFYIQGGDVGSLIARTMATIYRDDAALLGVHVNMLPLNHPWTNFKYVLGAFLPSGWVMDKDAERRYYPIAKALSYFIRETGYYHIQSTKPDTLGIAMNDSPVGLAAYILEKFSTATEKENPEKPDGGLLTNFPIAMDKMLDNIHVYWFTHTITTSMRQYAELARFQALRFDEIPSLVPFGVSSFWHELTTNPPSFVTIKFPNLVSYRNHDRCGHFASLECPELLAQDIFEFVKLAENQKPNRNTEL